MLLAPALTPAQIIRTVAGGRSTESGAAITTGFQPYGLAVDAGGNLFVSDLGHRVFKVTPAGTITLVAGNGKPGFSGDNGPATSASLQYPAGLAVDANGNLYIADSYNSRIRKVASDGTITTVAGDGTTALSGDGGAATQAKLYRPSGVAIDANGNILIADTQNNRIRSVSVTGVITTVAGGGVALGDGGLALNALIANPTGVATAANGNFYITDAGNSRLRKVNAAGQISSIAGNGTPGFSGDGGLATDAKIADPSAVTVDAAGNVYFADRVNLRIRRVAANGIINTFAGNGSAAFSGDGGAAGSAGIAVPLGVTRDANGNIFIADTGNSRIRKVSTDGLIGTFAGNGIGDGGLATRALLEGAGDVAIDKMGNLYVAEYYGQRVRKVTPDGNIFTVAGNGEYGFSGDGGPASSAKLNYPTAVALDAIGNLYIADYANNRIRKVTPGGIISTFAGDGTGHCGSCGGGSGPPNGDGGLAINANFYRPENIAVDTIGNLYIVDIYNGRVRKVNVDGVISTYVGGGTGNADGVLATSIYLYHPSGIATDANGNVFVAQSSSSVIRKVAANGIITTIAGNGIYGFSGDGGPAINASINYPRKLTVDVASNLYFSSTYSERIRKVASSGIISTVAGNGVSGFSGDGGPAISANLSAPIGVAVDSGGALLFTDGGARIRKVSNERFPIIPLMLWLLD